ncbi:MAG: hypothetical protein AMJ79_15475 [Phycisphaerae bacterium SM23_30]|nr:MAG: hypothetical protein AMJ79_15475 [Phycisphaerae bacterium SM23_30]
MKEIVQKLKDKEIEIAKEKGPLYLFALFLREDAPDNWDLVVAAPWINKDKSDSLKFIASKIQETLDHKELVKLSRIVIIDDTNPALEALHKAIHVEHGTSEIHNSNFFGLPISHAYIITSQRGNQSSPKTA